LFTHQQTFPVQRLFTLPAPPTLPGMDSSELTTKQAGIISEVVARHLGYMNRLRNRMDRVGILPSDELYAAVNAALNAAHSLRVKLHYLSCEPGHVHRQPKPPTPPSS
jgi:Fe2+ transport system protein FeoA